MAEAIHPEAINIDAVHAEHLLDQQPQDEVIAAQPERPNEPLNPEQPQIQVGFH